MAVYNILLEKGFKNITIEGIAKDAGVSKATLYKWCPNKVAVVLDGQFDMRIANAYRERYFAPRHQVARNMITGDSVNALFMLYRTL